MNDEDIKQLIKTNPKLVILPSTWKPGDLVQSIGRALRPNTSPEIRKIIEEELNKCM